MTGLLEIREKIKLIYGRYEVFILPVVKFLLAFVVLNTVNGKMGYMTQLDNVTIVLIVALLCSFLPTSFIVLFAAGFSLAHMYAFSLEVAVVGLCMYLIMFLLFFRFSPKDSLVVALTPLLCSMNIPYVVPLAVGLLCGPSSIVSLGCGVAVYYLLQTVIASVPGINTMADSEAVEKIRLIIDGLLGNKAMLVTIAAFVVTALVVYLIRRLSIDHSWTIAMAAGAMTDIVILLVGDLLYETNISVAGALLGSILALAVAKVIEFFRFCVDYSRTEKVQFEDDEYYYYVKAIPKMTVAVSSKTVKKINTQRSKGTAPAHGTALKRPVRQGAKNGKGGRNAAVEKSAGSRGGAKGRNQSRNGGRKGSGRSVTIGNIPGEAGNQDGTMDFEELF